MSGFKKILLDNNSPTIDIGSRVRVSQINTHGDLKLLNSDKNLLWESVGTGTGVFNNNVFTLSVSPGQYFIRATKRYFPYFSGKSQMLEMSFESFNFETDIIKRFGYFSSNDSLPYDLNYDGFFLENDGVNIKLKVLNNGVEKLNLDWTQWDNYSEIFKYDWAKFNVIMFDFLWLGGTALRVFLNIDGVFVLAHTFKYASIGFGTFLKSPNHKIRYEIRSTLGTGSFKQISSQISTEGQPNIAECSSYRTVYSPSIVYPTIGTKYPIKSLKLKTSHRDVFSQLSSAYALISSAGENALITFDINPVLSSPLAYTNVEESCMQEANGNGIITVVSSNIITEGFFVTSNNNGNVNFENNNILSVFGSTLNNKMDEIVMCITPYTSNIRLNSIMNYREL